MQTGISRSSHLLEAVELFSCLLTAFNVSQCIPIIFSLQAYVVYLSLCCVFINVPTLSKRFDLVSFFPHSLAYCLLHSEFLALSVCHHSLDGSASSVLKSSRDAAVSTAPLHAFHVQSASNLSLSVSFYIHRIHPVPYR